MATKEGVQKLLDKKYGKGEYTAYSRIDNRYGFYVTSRGVRSFKAVGFEWGDVVRYIRMHAIP